MPYDPGISYHGDQYIYQGITNAANVLGDGVQKALQRYGQIQQENAFGSDTMHNLANLTKDDGTPYVPIDALNRYEAASSNQKAGMLRAAQSGYAMDIARQAAASENALHAAQANRLEADAHNLWLGDGGAGAGKPAFTPQITVLKDPQTGKDISVYSRGPNQWDPVPGTEPAHPMAYQKSYNTNGDEIGEYDADGRLRLYHQTDPAKQAEAELLRKAAEAAAAARTNVSTPNPLNPLNWLKSTNGTGAPKVGEVQQGNGSPQTIAPVIVGTPAEAVALPPGTRYQTPDGKIYVR